MTIIDSTYSTSHVELEVNGFVELEFSGVFIPVEDRGFDDEFGSNDISKLLSVKASSNGSVILTARFRPADEDDTIVDYLDDPYEQDDIDLDSEDDDFDAEYEEEYAHLDYTYGFAFVHPVDTPAPLAHANLDEDEVWEYRAVLPVSINGEDYLVTVLARED
jgi:hypothetical protein